MTEAEFKKKLRDLEDEYNAASLETINALEKLADRYHVILTSYLNAENFDKKTYEEMIEDYYNEYIKILLQKELPKDI